jgi:PAS domain S-box-containing protein
MCPVAVVSDISTVLEALVDGVVNVDARGFIVYMNAAAERAIGAQRSDLLHKPCSEAPLPFNLNGSGDSIAFQREGRSYRVRASTVDEGCRLIQIRDVTAEVDSEAELHRSQEFLQAVLDNIEAGIAACDETGTLRLFNNATRRFHGIPEQPLAAEEWARRYSLYAADGVTPLDKEDVPLYRAFSGEVVRNAEIVICPEDGPRRTVLTSGRAITGRDGRKLGAVVAMNDISHRKHSGARIREALRQFRTLFNDGPIAYHEIDREGIIRRVNRAECRLLGRTREEITGKPAWAFVAEEDREAFRVEILQRLSGLWPLEPTEREYVTASGDRLVVELHENLIYRSAGEIGGLRTAMLDVTERRHRQLAQAESAEIRSILERIGDAYIAFDTDWRYTYVNGKAAELARKPASELIGRCVWDEFPESVNTPFYTELHRAMREQVPIEFDNYFAPLDKYFQNTVYPSPSGVGVFYRDVSERRRTEIDLRNRSIELARKNAELGTFASVVSHDLQEPLRMIGGYAGLLERRYSGSLDDDAKEFLTFVTRGVERMDRLIKDLLALCRLEDAVDSPMAKVDVGHIADFVCGNLSLSIEDSGASIDVGRLPVVQFHPTHLIQVLQNLVGNALKYRSNLVPRIELRSHRVDGAWQFTVKDNGIGFDMRYAEQVFRPFKRLKRSEEGGTGIGLAICKKVVESRGGRIWVESTPGGGSTFYFTVPDALPVRD